MTYLGNKDFFVEVQKGNVAGHAMVHKFGKNGAVPNNTFEHVSIGSGATSFLSAATTVRVKAGNANDTAGGNGAQAITVIGIDTTLAEVSENLVTAGGTASSNSSASFWRVYRAYVANASCGTYGAANTAAVVIENSGGGTDLITIATEEGQTQYAGYTVPLGKTAYWLGAHIMVDSAKAADVRMLMRKNFNDVTTPFEPIRLVNYWDGLAGHMNFQPRSPGKFEALTDIWFEAEGSSGSATEVSVDFELLLVDD